MQTFIEWVIKLRILVVVLTLVITVLLVKQIKGLTFIFDPDATIPQSHPYTVAGNFIEEVFGNKYTVVIGITPNSGDIYQPAVLNKVKALTAKLQEAEGVVRRNTSSLSAKKSKGIEGVEDSMVVKRLMDKTPSTEAEFADLKKAIEINPVYQDFLVSEDGKTTQIVAEFKKIEGGFKSIKKSIDDIIESEKEDSIDVAASGLVMFLGQLEVFSARMGKFFPLALLIIGLIHYEAFRTWQALFLPLVTALLAVIWSIGILGISKQPFDVFNSTTPILILAIAAGHAVQILKRFYEEFANVKEANPEMPAKKVSEQAVLQTLTKVGPVMMVACAVAALGFFSLTIFEIKSIRTFGIISGAGVLSALVLELTFIPAIRVMLPPPGEKELRREKEETFWDRLVSRLYRLVMTRRKQIYQVFAVVFIVAIFGAYLVKVDNSQKGYFYGSLKVRTDDDKLNARMGGTNPFYFLVSGTTEDAIKRPDVLKFMEDIQNFVKSDEQVGKTISLVDFVKKMNQSMNSEKKEFYQIPENQDLVGQYLLLYSSSGDPGDFDNLVDNGYKNAVIAVFMHTHSSAHIDGLVKKVMAYSQGKVPAGVELKAGGGSLGGVALNEIMIREKILNILQILGAVFFITMLVFRSPVAGFLILVPLLAAVAVNFGAMGILGIPLQTATALVSAMAVGIGADYGIYMSYRMREELKTMADENKAIEKSFKSAGKAAIFVSTAVAGGFGVLMFSWGFMIHMWLGFLISVAMLVSSLTALTLFPALVLSLRPKFIFGEKPS